MDHDHPILAAFAVIAAGIKKSALYIGGWLVSIGLAGFNEVMGAISVTLVVVLTGIRIWKELRSKEPKQ